jgi:hypothetical protein
MNSESTAASHSPIHHGRNEGDPSDAAPEEQGQQAMRVVLLIPLGVAFILIVPYLVTRRDEEEQPGGHGRTILEALIDLLSWRW